MTYPAKNRRTVSSADLLALVGSHGMLTVALVMSGLGINRQASMRLLAAHAAHLREVAVDSKLRDILGERLTRRAYVPTASFTEDLGLTQRLLVSEQDEEDDGGAALDNATTSQTLTTRRGVAHYSIHAKHNIVKASEAPLPERDPLTAAFFGK